MTVIHQPGAFDIPTFCTRNHIGRSQTYVEIRTRRLRSMKCGSRRLISPEAEKDWQRLCERAAVSGAK